MQLSADRGSVFYQGMLYDKEPDKVGPKTFLDRVAVKSGEKKRVFESDNDNVYESVSTVLDPDAVRLILERQSPTEVAQFYLVDGGSRGS